MDIRGVGDDPAYGMAAVFSAGGIGASVLAKGPSPAVKGLSIAGLYGLGGYLTKKNEQANQGLMVGLGTSTAVTGMGLERALRTQKAIPMAVTVLGVINCAYYGRKLYDRWDLTMT